MYMHVTQSVVVAVSLSVCEANYKFIIIMIMFYDIIASLGREHDKELLEKRIHIST